MIEGIVYFLYLFLVFAEVAVLLASATGFFVFIAWQVIGKIRSLIDAPMNAKPRDTKPPVKTLSPVGVAAGRPVRQITGAHNERF